MSDQRERTPYSGRGRDRSSLATSPATERLARFLASSRKRAKRGNRVDTESPIGDEGRQLKGRIATFYFLGLPPTNLDLLFYV